jgi:hypothetical protein
MRNDLLVYLGELSFGDTVPGDNISLNADWPTQREASSPEHQDLFRLSFVVPFEDSNVIRNHSGKIFDNLRSPLL